MVSASSAVRTTMSFYQQSCFSYCASSLFIFFSITGSFPLSNTTVDPHHYHHGPVDLSLLCSLFLMHVFTSVWSHLNIASLTLSSFHVKKLTFLVSYSGHLLFGCFLTSSVIFGSSIYFREINCSWGAQQLDIVLKKLGGFFCVYICSRRMEVQEV